VCVASAPQYERAMVDAREMDAKCALTAALKRGDVDTLAAALRTMEQQTSLQKQWDDDCCASDHDGGDGKKQRRHERLKERPRAASDRVIDASAGYLNPKMMKAPKLRKQSKRRSETTNAARVRASIRETVAELRRGDRAGPAAAAAGLNRFGACRPCAPAETRVARAKTRARAAAASAIAFFHQMGRTRALLCAGSVLFLFELAHWLRYLKEVLK
jgi:hypothetical protein